LSIKVLSKINEEAAKQIREVENICKAHDKTNGNISLDSSLNFYPEMKSIFLFYEDDKLISLLSIFMPTEKEAEISAYTLPEHRRKGFFKKLLNKAIEELKKYKLTDLLFVCEPQSKDGREAIKKLDAELCFTEYFLRYRGSLMDLEKQQQSRIRLQMAVLKDLEAIAIMSQQIFNDNYEGSKSMAAKSFEADNRTQYIAVLDDKPVGVGAVSFENDEASIFGLGILPQYQGNGFGKEFFNLILLELKRKGLQNISIEVDSANKNALNLYVKSGFAVETSYDYYRKHMTNST
jgi:ribosomal protein S18 acetylase RimI-like enzyme